MIKLSKTIISVLVCADIIKASIIFSIKVILFELYKCTINKGLM